jgi:hypothetical protein
MLIVGLLEIGVAGEDLLSKRWSVGERGNSVVEALTSRSALLAPSVSWT